jgi:hypothetical protein
VRREKLKVKRRTVESASSGTFHLLHFTFHENEDGYCEPPAGEGHSGGSREHAIMLLANGEYLNLGRQLARLLGSCLEGASGDELRKLARA